MQLGMENLGFLYESSVVILTSKLTLFGESLLILRKSECFDPKSRIRKNFTFLIRTVLFSRNYSIFS